MKNRFFLISVISILGVLLVFFGIKQLRRHTDSQNCGNQMVAICFAARVWADDNNGRYPPDFRSMSNELATTRILICPNDKSRSLAKDFASLTADNSSYEIIESGIMTTNFDQPFLRCKVDGYLGYCDGTFSDGKQRRQKF